MEVDDHERIDTMGKQSNTRRNSERQTYRQQQKGETNK